MKYKVTVEYEFEADELEQAIHFSKDMKRKGIFESASNEDPFYYVNVTRSQFDLKEIPAKN